MHLFVTGATGFVGTAVVADLLAAGHRVVGLARSSGSAQDLRAVGAEIVRASLTDLGALQAAAAASQGVLHLAFRHTDPYDQAVQTDLGAIQAIGETLSGTGRPFVITSGTLVLPPGRLAREVDPPDPSSLAAARAGNESAALALADRGVRASVVRLAPVVHDRVKAGFVGALVDIAAKAGFSGYLGDGAQRWPTLNRADAARLFRLAAERAPAGAVLHGVAEQGVALRAIAEAIGAGLGLPVRSVPAADAAAHFGWLAATVATDAPASSEATRTQLDWQPTAPGLLEGLEHGWFSDGSNR